MKLSNGILSIFTVAILTATSAFAGGRQQVLQVTSNAISGKFPFYVDTSDNDSLIAMVFPALSGGALRQLTLSALNSVNSDDSNMGVLILQQDDYKVIYLKGQGVHPSSGGRITMSYLTNGLTNNYDTFDMNISMENHHWVLRTLDGQMITGMFLKKGMLGLKAPKLYDVQFAPPVQPPAPPAPPAPLVAPQPVPQPLPQPVPPAADPQPVPPAPPAPEPQPAPPAPPAPPVPPAPPANDPQAILQPETPATPEPQPSLPPSPVV